MHNSYRCNLSVRLGAKAVGRIFIFSLIWLILTGSDTASWLIGAPAVLLAAGLSLTLAAPSYWPLSLAGLCRFIPFFLRQSALSGIDVMRRALALPPDVNPGLVIYDTFLPAGAPRISFVNTISLLPGTLSADLQDSTIAIHTLDKSLPIWASIQSLEHHLAVVFRISPKGKELE